jgi:hypothetical protein
MRSQIMINSASLARVRKSTETRALPGALATGAVGGVDVAVVWMDAFVLVFKTFMAILLNASAFRGATLDLDSIISIAAQGDGRPACRAAGQIRARSVRDHAGRE